MHSKRRSIATSLVAIVLLLAVVLCFALSATYATAETSEELASEDAGVETTAITDEDYSSYTDQELPASLSNKNISQYVPISKFNKNGTTVFNGRNYGFVIYSSANTNHVLIFKEIYTPHEDGGGYDVSLQVIYQNSFFKSGNSILNAGSPYKISLSNIKFDNYLFDSQMSNNILCGSYNYKTDDGVYYIQSRYDSSLSYFNKDELKQGVITVTSSIVTIGLTVAFPPAAALAGAKVAYASGKIINSIVKMSTNLWEDTTKSGIALDFPLARQAQIDKYGGLRKNVSLDMPDGAEEYLSDSGNYSTASFRVMNDNNKDYYVYNNVSFDVCRYTGAEHHNVDSATIESVYSVTGTDCNQYSQVTGNNGDFGYESYQRFSPIAKTNLFNFVPDQEGDYTIMVPPSYYLTVDGVAQLDNRVHVGADGCKIGVASSLGMQTGDKVYSRLLTQDFCNGEIGFANISIQKDQQLNINEPTRVNDLAYALELSDVTNNDIYILDAGENVDYLDLYITDENLNVLAKSIKKDGKLYVNYPMKANEIYSVICVNNSGVTLDVNVQKASGISLVEGLNDAADIQGLYYSYNPRYNQIYDIYGGELYDENMNQLSIYEVFLQSSETYYLYHNINEEVYISFSGANIYPYFELGEIIYGETALNDIIFFTPAATAFYKFDNGIYDIMVEESYVAKDVNSYILQKDINYIFFKRELGGYTRIYLDYEEIGFGTNSIDPTSPYSAYKLSVEERIRLDINIDKSNSLSVYDESLIEIELNHGYLLTSGDYYVIVKDSGAYNITIQEYIQQIEVTLYVDSAIFEDTTGAIYYYGKKATLPAPTKKGYDFNGWRSRDILITDSNGVTYGELLADSLTLVADWTIRDIVMEINLGANTAKWYWTGETFNSQNQPAHFEGEIIDQLINMKSEFIKLEDGKKHGYFLSAFDYQKISSEDHVDYYEFTPVWEVEKYYIEFINTSSQIFTPTRMVAYGEEMAMPVFPLEVFSFGNGIYYLAGWQTSIESDVMKFSVGDELCDLTPDYGSEYNYDYDGDGEFDCTLVRLTAYLRYIDYSVFINNGYYRVSPTEGYAIGNLGKYGFTESDYYGYNVLLKTPVVGATEAITYVFDGGVITVEHLKSFWTRGLREVSIVMEIVSKPITVALTYAYPDSDNPEKYEGENDKTLNPAFVRGYKFVDWTVDGIEMGNQLNYGTLQVNQYYSDLKDVTVSRHLGAKLTMTFIKATSGISYTISDEVVCVDLSIFMYMVGMTFTIESSTKQVTFVNGNCTTTNIVINSRNDKLIINFDNVKISASKSKNAIDASACPDLELYSENYVYLAGGQASTGRLGVAVLCKNLTLLGNAFDIVGGSSSSCYFTGRAGIYSVGDSNSKLNISASEVNVTGGTGGNLSLPTAPSSDSFLGNDTIGANGSNGSDGKNGSNGAVAIYFPGTIVLNSGCKLTCTGGRGGHGDNGGNGQRGGDGRDGKFGVTTIDPGKGGDGGNGGKGGDGGKPMVYGNFINYSGSDNYTGKGGEGGQGGYGGLGAPGGASSYTIWGNERPGTAGLPGNPGGKGEAGISTAA